MQETRREISTVRLQNLSYGHKQSATLMAAVKLDLFTTVAQVPRGFQKSQKIWG